MTLPELIVQGDEAWTPEELAAKERRRIYEREYRRRRYQTDPEYRERIKAYMETRRRASGVRPRNRRSQARMSLVRVLYARASLHDVGCTGPTYRTGCRCAKIELAWLRDGAA